MLLLSHYVVCDDVSQDRTSYGTFECCEHASKPLCRVLDKEIDLYGEVKKYVYTVYTDINHKDGF